LPARLRVLGRKCRQAKSRAKLARKYGKTARPDR